MDTPEQGSDLVLRQESPRETQITWLRERERDIPDNRSVSFADDDVLPDEDVLAALRAGPRRRE